MNTLKSKMSDIGPAVVISGSMCLSKIETGYNIMRQLYEAGFEGNFEKVYAVEPFIHSIEDAKLKFKCLSQNIRDKIEIHNVFLDETNTLDNIIGSGKPTLIGMDIEGAVLS